MKHLAAKPLPPLRDVTHHEVTLVLPEGRTLLGPNLHLESCRLIVPAGAELLVAGARLDACRVEAVRLADLHCRHATFNRCTFAGTFVDINFGMGESALRDCDFRQGRLIDCEFHRVNIDEQAYAGWPAFVIRHPRINADIIRRAPWPPGSDKFALFVQLIAQAHETVTGFASDAKYWSMRFHVPLVALRTAVEEIQPALANDLAAPYFHEGQEARPGAANLDEWQDARVHSQGRRAAKKKK